jgi:hypothetical protein
MRFFSITVHKNYDFIDKSIKITILLIKVYTNYDFID